MTASCQSIEGKLMLWSVELMRKRNHFSTGKVKKFDKATEGSSEFSERMFRSVPSEAVVGSHFR